MAREAEAAAKQEHWPTGEARFAILTTEQYQVRFETAHTELFRQLPFLAQHWNQGSKIHKDVIRRRMVRQLEHEPMCLLVIDPGTEMSRAAKLATQNLAL